MTFHESQTQALAPDIRRAGLVAALRATGDGLEHALDVTQQRWVVGSKTDCDVVIEDPFVSQHHCILERRTSGGLVVRDRNSRNGTHVDGNRVEGAELRIGSYLTVGRTTLVAVAAPGGRTPDTPDGSGGDAPRLRRSAAISYATLRGGEPIGAAKRRGP